jgi:hypothetical protein
VNRRSSYRASEGSGASEMDGSSVIASQKLDPLSDTLATALLYAELGWRIIPCKAADKSPHIKDWRGRATTKADDIKRWWKRWPEALIGVLTGDGGPVVLDVDEKNGKHGEAALAALVLKYGPLPQSIEHRTPSGGRQIWFCLPEGQRLPTRVCGLGDGLDVKADAGYVVVPPSLMADGRQYKWINTPLTHDLALAPTWIAVELHTNAQPQNAGKRKPIGDDSLAARDPAKLSRALLTIPNEDRNYDEWIAALHAYKAAVRGDEELYEPFEEWSLLYPKNTRQVTREKWDSVFQSSIGAGYIYRLARQYGFDEAPEDFVGTEDQWRVRKNRPVIECIGGELDQIIVKAERELVAAKDGIYVYGNMLVRPAIREIEASDGRKTMAIRLVPLDEAYLRERLTAVVRFQKYDNRTKSLVVINCPYEVARAILSHGNWDLPEVTGFTDVPILRPDGTLLKERGYDAANSQLYDSLARSWDAVLVFLSENFSDSFLCLSRAQQITYFPKILLMLQRADKTSAVGPDALAGSAHLGAHCRVSPGAPDGGGHFGAHRWVGPGAPDGGAHFGADRWVGPSALADGAHLGADHRVGPGTLAGGAHLGAHCRVSPGALAGGAHLGAHRRVNQGELAVATKFGTITDAVCLAHARFAGLCLPGRHRGVYAPQLRNGFRRAAAEAAFGGDF